MLITTVKKICSVMLLSLLLSVTLFGCAPQAAETVTSDGVSSIGGIAEVEPMAEEDYICKPYSKDGVADFVSVALTRPMWMRWAGELTEENCDNVTPKLVREQLECEIFKLNSSNLSLLYLDGEIYQLGEYFGGSGVQTALPCDYDGDGDKDILFTFSWGEAGSLTHLAVFNTETQMTHHLHSVTGSDLIALPAEQEDVLFRVYSPVVAADQQIGAVVRTDGKLTFTALEIPAE